MDREQILAASEGWQEALWSDTGRLGLEYLQGRALSDEFIRKYHLGYTGEAERYGNSISLPVLDARGRVRAMRFRRLDGKPKYTQVRGERPHLFNVSSVKHYIVYVTEGEFDAILMEQLGFNAVGVPGANSFRDDWRWLFIGNDVRIVFDGDAPGLEAARKLEALLVKVADNTAVVELPAEHDISSLYTEDPKALYEVLEAYDA